MVQVDGESISYSHLKSLLFKPKEIGWKPQPAHADDKPMRMCRHMDQFESEYELTTEELDRYFAKKTAMIKAKNDAAGIELEEQLEKVLKRNAQPLTKYVEPLFLNRRGHSSMFKAVSRNKREAVSQTNFNPKFEMPSSATYRPKISAVKP